MGIHIFLKYMYKGQVVQKSMDWGNKKGVPGSKFFLTVHKDNYHVQVTLSLMDTLEEAGSDKMAG